MTQDQLLTILFKKYAKRALSRLEENDLQNPLVRKIILDAFGDLRRDIEAQELVNTIVAKNLN